MNERNLTSLQHPLVKHWVRLRTKSSYRKEQGRVLVSGKKVIHELAQKWNAVSLLVVDGQDLPQNLLPAEQIIRCSQAILKKVTGLEEPDGWAAEFPQPSPRWTGKEDRVLVLDRLGDPGNLGTLLRTSLALGWKAVFLVGDGVDPYNEKALRAARGATFQLPLKEGSWGELVQEVQQRQGMLVIADLNGKLPNEIPTAQPLYLVLCNEAHGAGGIQAEGVPIERVTIPMDSQVESLNVAVAGSILMYGLGRQQ